MRSGASKFDSQFITRDLIRIWGGGIIVLSVTMCIMFFSPFAIQFEKGDQVVDIHKIGEQKNIAKSLNYQKSMIVIDSLFAQLPSQSRRYSCNSFISSENTCLREREMHIETFELSELPVSTQYSLTELDSMISIKQIGLSNFPFFDRYLPTRERKDAQRIRSEIYELQWQRIKCLENAGMEDELFVALKPYKRFVGYHQTEANELYFRLKK